MHILVLLAVVIVIMVALMHYRATSRGQTVCEVCVDAMYGIAAIAYAVAQAADAALVRYRLARAEIRAAHTPMYAEACR